MRRGEYRRRNSSSSKQLMQPLVPHGMVAERAVAVAVVEELGLVIRDVVVVVLLVLVLGKVQEAEEGNVARLLEHTYLVLCLGSFTGVGARNTGVRDLD